mgnify:CR=1 FL=1
MELQKNDYLDPACPFDSSAYTGKAETIPVRRVLEKVDDYLGRNDYDGAERTLLYWLGEARRGGDGRGELSVRNELMGLYRKQGRGEEAVAQAELALGLADTLGLEGSVTAGTTLVNAATVYKAFSQADRAIGLYEQARSIYEQKLPPRDDRLGGLYNNMALALTDLARYGEARDLYAKALWVMGQAPNGALEQAITWLNLADLAAAEQGLEAADEDICDCVDRAWELLQAPELPRDGYYAFVCEKCAPTFGYYGYVARKTRLLQQAEEIYAGA